MAHVLPSGGGKALMNVDDTTLLLLDHQTGLFQTVKDITVAELRANVIALVECALDSGQFQAAVLTGCWAWRSSYCAGLR